MVFVAMAPVVDAPLLPTNAGERLEDRLDLGRLELAAIGQQDQLRRRRVAAFDSFLERDERLQRTRNRSNRGQQLAATEISMRRPISCSSRAVSSFRSCDAGQIGAYEIDLDVRNARLRRFLNLF